ncbi:hypothetical protein PIB30_035949 [Stylosanthes scabra]|uniref:Uncharacterized protein n=1 Tax=Stylosanthes scabra TaxID=79078 RepID=A0ABU6QCR2_9FABA|nr:hypothetical protein [Stylosanthes scabra]
MHNTIPYTTLSDIPTTPEQGDTTSSKTTLTESNTQPPIQKLLEWRFHLGHGGFIERQKINSFEPFWGEEAQRRWSSRQWHDQPPPSFLHGRRRSKLEDSDSTVTAGAILPSTVESSSFPSFLLEMDLPPPPNNDDDDLWTTVEIGARRQRASPPSSRHVLHCSNPLSLRTLNMSLSLSPTRRRRPSLTGLPLPSSIADLLR